MHCVILLALKIAGNKKIHELFNFIRIELYIRKRNNKHIYSSILNLHSEKISIFFIHWCTQNSEK